MAVFLCPRVEQLTCTCTLIVMGILLHVGRRGGVLGFATCYVAGEADSYTGHISTSASGYTCQYWISDSPHTHSYDTDDKFPADGTAVAAKNYCRSPDAATPWCYTTNSSVRFEYCTAIPFCPAKPCSAGDTAGVANPGLKTDDIGTTPSVNYLMKDSALEFKCCGVVAQWSFYIRNPGNLALQVWRKDGALFRLVGKNDFSFSPGEIDVLHVETVAPNDRISFRSGDLIGWYSSGPPMISSEAGTYNYTIAKTMTGEPAVQDVVDFAAGTLTTENQVDFAVEADIAPSFAPYFTNSLSTIRIKQSTNISTTVLQLTASDQEQDHVNDLVYLFEESPLFMLESETTGKIVVRSSLSAGNYSLVARVVDPCQLEGQRTFVFEVYNEPATFVNWPTGATASTYSTSNGDSVVNVTVVDPEGDATALSLGCNPAGCPWEITAGGNIYSNDNLLLHKVPSYDVTVIADDGTTIVTSPVITITLPDVNTAPGFLSLPACSPTCIVPETKLAGDVVLTVPFTDPDPDTVTATINYDPPSCAVLYTHVVTTSGTCTNTPEIRVQAAIAQDFETSGATLCNLTMTLFDGRENSDPEWVNLLLADVEEPPAFTSDNYYITTPEVASGTLLPSPGISAPDPEGLAVTYSSNCGAQSSNIAIDPNTAAVTMAAEFDLDLTNQPTYDIVCVITARDPPGQSSSATLTITVTDVNDRSPTFTSGMYSFTVSSQQAVGSIVGRVFVSDADVTSPNNLFTLSHAGAAKFLVDADGNVILTGNITDDASVTPYMMTVTATDGGSGGLVGTTTVQILVSDIPTTPTPTGSDTTFFSFWENVLWYSIALVLLGFIAFLSCCLVWKFCRDSCRRQSNKSHANQKKQGDSDRKQMKRNMATGSYHPMQTLNEQGVPTKAVDSFYPPQNGGLKTGNIGVLSKQPLNPSSLTPVESILPNDLDGPGSVAFR